MAAIQESNLSQITARAGVLRAGTGRADCAPPSYQLKLNSGELIWNRPTEKDGDPSSLAPAWVTRRV